ncbi:MAG: hypothetical protein Mars2KO_06650 [Maribacter sp.]
MRKIAFLFIAALGIVTLNAQTSGQMATYNSFSADGGVTDALLNYADGDLSEKYTESSLVNDQYIQGSPYLSNSFSPTPLYYKDDVVGNVFYRYNALNEEVEIMKTQVEGETIRGLAKDKELNIRPNGKKMSFKTFITASDRTVNGYLTELVNGNTYDLYKRIHVKFSEAKAPKNTFEKAVPARFTKYVEFYVQKEGANRIDQILPKKSKFLNLLDADNKEAAKQFIKENDLNLKTEADMTKLFTFLNK